MLEDTICTSANVEQTNNIPSRTQSISHESETKNGSQLVLTKAIPFKQGIKMYLNMCCTYVLHSSVGTICISNLCWPNPNHTSEDTKCSSTRVNRTIPLPARTKWMHVNTLSWDRGHKMYHKNCWLNPTKTREGTKPISIYASNASEDKQFQYVLIKPTHSSVDKTCPRMHAKKTKCISIRDYPKHPMSDRTKNVSQYVSTKTPTMPARTQCISQHELTKNIQC